jgi:hypothetical protein
MIWFVAKDGNNLIFRDKRWMLSLEFVGIFLIDWFEEDLKIIETFNIKFGLKTLQARIPENCIHDLLKYFKVHSGIRNS